MGFVMDYIVAHSDHRIDAYDTLKHRIDTDSEGLFGDFEDHDAGRETYDKSKNRFAETHPSPASHEIIQEDIDKKLNKSPLKYFLDGSRHVYKTNEMIISGNVYPVVVGQIIVGCCQRNRRNIEQYKICRKLILVVPQGFDYDDQGENYLRKKCEEINTALKEKEGDNSFSFDRIVCYPTDGDLTKEKNKFLYQAITVVQNEMMDQEQTMVGEMCSDPNNILNNRSWLVKDGTLEYKRDFTNRPDEDLDIAKYKHKLKNVIGVSKDFNPELLSLAEPKIGRIISELQPHYRTNAYKYKHEGKMYCVWYLRLRNTPNKATLTSDVIKVEFILPNDDLVDTALIDNISAHLINEAYPVCYGKDNRWAKHLYPVYLTESFCKAKYINEKIITKKI